MTTRSGSMVAALLLALGCGGGAVGDGDGGVAGGAGDGGTGGIAGSMGDADLIGSTGCSFVTPAMPPPDVSCAAECTLIGGVGSADRLVYQLACVPDASLQRPTPPTANEICMTSPVDKRNYFVGSPVTAQAVADVCWVLCGLTPRDPAFEEWLEIEFDLWQERCAEIWDL